MKNFGFWILSVYFLLQITSFSANAQTPVGVEFRGEWHFDRAEIQEKSAGSMGDYSTESTLLLSEFTQKPYFRKIPTHIAFREGKFLTYTAGATWFLKVFAYINDSGEIEFRDAMDSPVGYDDEENVKEMNIEAYPMVATYYNPVLSGNIMICQYHYSRNSENGDMEGIVTLYYNRGQ